MGRRARLVAGVCCIPVLVLPSAVRADELSVRGLKQVVALQMADIDWGDDASCRRITDHRGDCSYSTFGLAEFYDNEKRFTLRDSRLYEQSVDPYQRPPEPVGPGRLTTIPVTMVGRQLALGVWMVSRRGRWGALHLKSVYRRRPVTMRCRDRSTRRVDLDDEPPAAVAFDGSFAARYPIWDEFDEELRYEIRGRFIRGAVTGTVTLRQRLPRTSCTTSLAFRAAPTKPLPRYIQAS